MKAATRGLRRIAMVEGSQQRPAFSPAQRHVEKDRPAGACSAQ